MSDDMVKDRKLSTMGLIFLTFIASALGVTWALQFREVIVMFLPNPIVALVVLTIVMYWIIYIFGKRVYKK